MAPIKRPRPHTNEVNLELTGVDSATSNFRGISNKKARVSDSRPSQARRLAARNAFSSEDSDEDDSENNAGGRGQRSGLETLEFQEEIQTEDEDLDTERATQMIEERNQRVITNRPAENGIIHSITCINFMCHAKLQVKLGPLMNFIIGRNGSGKSAVLTAITLCLGGRATATNRGQSLKSFIKEGENNATLIVKLKNYGYSGFQQEKYGDWIVIERSFSRTGASSFKLKSDQGAVVSQRKADLDEICDYFALQLDNPMNVLTQDNARQFLNSSDPAEKYRFFVKGVHLEQLDKDYVLLRQVIDNIEIKIETRNGDVSILESKAKKAASRSAISRQFDDMREKIEAYGNQMAWAQVEEQEKIRQEIEDELVRNEEQILAAEKRQLTSERGYEEANASSERAVRAADEVKEALRPIKNEQEHLKADFQKTKDDLQASLREERMIREYMKTARVNIKKANDDIALELRRLEERNGGSHAERLAEIDASRAQATEARRIYEEHKEKLPALEEVRREAEMTLQRSKEALEPKRAEIRICEERISNLQRNRNEQASAFPPGMPQLLRAIKEDAGFREQPVGPIGKHIRLLKPVWSSILEKSFGATLNGFIVTSKQDQIRLSGLMRKVNCNNCPVLIGNNTPIDTSNTEPDPEFLTTLRALEIDNDLVAKQLIINNAIEQTILIESREEAEHVMFGGSRLRNVKQCFSLNDAKRGWGVRVALTRGGEASTAPMPAWEGRPRMGTDIEAQIGYQRDNLQHLKRELNGLGSRVREIQAHVLQSRQAIERHHRQRNDLKMQLQEREEKIDKLQEDLDQDSVEGGRLDALKQGLKEAEDEKAHYEHQFEDSVISRDRLNEESAGLRRQLDDISTKLTSGEAKLKKAEVELLKLQNERQAALEAKNTAFDDVNETREERDKTSAKHEAQEALISDYTRQAEEISARVEIDPGETPDSLDRKLTKLSEDLKRFQKKIGATQEEIEIEAANTHLAFETAKEQVTELQDLADLLKGALMERRARWNKFQRFISARARAQFTYLLSERSFRGMLKTDHVNRLLDLHIEPDETKTSGAGRQTKTLSGGEKSFSTICLLLSLWEAMGSPIRCLDEFDVFMDNVNRDISMNMLITAAERSVGRQFILITPLDISNARHQSENVKIIKLGDPERGQQALPFGTSD